MERLSEHDKGVLDVIFDPLQLMSNSNVDVPEELMNEKIENPEIACLVKRATVCAESGDLKCALELFDEAISKCPDQPLVLNDRAQALRLAGKVEDALLDLNKAVEISEGKGKAGTKALCQRGLIHRLAGRDDEAKSDFEVASKNGSAFARTQLVNMNPYAAMCNAMLREIHSKSISS